ncbi:MAG: hypothetical protein L0211_22790, partial [Planctomycetaceae bacterium]|nr:hypothetical protein [Planctomycetaceae bacterium]
MLVSSGGGWVSPQQALFASQQAAAIAAAQKREAALAKAVSTGRTLWQLAQDAEKEADLRLASRLYQRLALMRPKTTFNGEAQGRLRDIQGRAAEKLQTLDDELANLKLPKSDPTGLALAKIDAVAVASTFELLDALALEYAGVVTVEDKINDKIKRLKKDAKFAEILQEPTAAELWKLGQEYEEKGEPCCALLVYQQGADLAPAPSARLARERLKELQANKHVVAAAERCQLLQRCHETYRKAQVAIEANPDRARQYLREIIESAPTDTKIYQDARMQIAAL